MNLKQRLKKLETIIDPTGFCACHSQIRTELWMADLGEDSESSEPKLNGDPVPDICPDCGKSIEKHKIILQLVDGTTKDRFPEEWNKRNK